ncbi:MAG: hypothetical protein EOP49_29215 [Sphingobacteriales bacterium]|nr:MAG: hypothetical protein EOP49_29215 [Sphingobacteriales bacterium]
MKAMQEIKERIMQEFAASGAQPGDFLSADFMQKLNTSLERDDQECYQQAAAVLLEAGWISLGGTSLQLTQAGWEYLHR